MFLAATFTSTITSAITICIGGSNTSTEGPSVPQSAGLKSTLSAGGELISKRYKDRIIAK